MASLSIFGVLAIAASAHLPMLVVLQDGSPASSFAANKIDKVAPAAANIQLASASASELHMNVIPATMKVQSTSQRPDMKITKPRALRSSQRAVAAAEAKPRAMRASLDTTHWHANLQRGWLLIVGKVQPDVSYIPEIVFSEPFSTTIICGADSGTCTLASTAAVQFTIYRSSGGSHSELVANVI
jgi:hypothetical protein